MPFADDALNDVENVFGSGFFSCWERNAVHTDYNFAEFLPERRKIMQTWANCLNELPSRVD